MYTKYRQEEPQHRLRESLSNKTITRHGVPPRHPLYKEGSRDPSASFSKERSDGIAYRSPLGAIASWRCRTIARRRISLLSLRSPPFFITQKKPDTAPGFLICNFYLSGSAENTLPFFIPLRRPANLRYDRHSARRRDPPKRPAYFQTS